MRVRPPQVSDVHISNVRVSNVKTAEGSFSCYQAMVLLGPVAASFNGTPGTAILPITNVTVSDSDFGTPRNSTEPWFAYNVQGLKLRNVRIDGKEYNV